MGANLRNGCAQGWTALSEATDDLGAKAAALGALARAGAATAGGWAIPLAAAARDPAAALAQLRDRDPSIFARPVVVRLSPEALTPGLAPAEPCDDAAAAADALQRMWALWTSDRAGRRRRAAGAATDAAEAGPCAAIVQPACDAVARIRRWSPETGAPEARAPESDAPDAELEALAAVAEDALSDRLGAPLDIEIGRTPDGGLAVLGARPIRAPTRAQVAIALSRAAGAAGTADNVAAEETALLALRAERLDDLLHATLPPGAPRDAVGLGLAASPGAAAGRLCFDAALAVERARAGEPALLARSETTPDDVAGVAAAAGLLTLRGGLSSHAAVVARGLGAPCVVGAGASGLHIEGDALTSRDGRRFVDGDWITIDGSSGDVLAGRAPLEEPQADDLLARLMAVADRHRRLAVRANADTPRDAETALSLGAEGVGLCRTEHMFFDAERITAMRRMIMADGEEARRDAIEILLPMQRADFERLFDVMVAHLGPGAPVTVRLLDPPLHEFLPQDPAGLARLARALGEDVAKVARRAEDLREFNPMLGKRGCRLGVAYPEIYEMQARALFEAAHAVRTRRGAAPKIEIMIPLVSAVRELALLRSRIAAVDAAVAAETGETLEFGVGIMVETPRAALRADALGPLCAFFSFGTNDLTQMTYGLSRDDASRLMRDYVERGVFEADPFADLDEDGVGELIRIGVDRGRGSNPDLAIGLCGEHGANPRAVAFCENADFDYVSCSPYRAPIARLAAAQAAIRRRRSGR